MKIFKKVVVLFAVVLLLAAAAPAALAASDTSVEAGKTATLTFEFKDVFNVDGVFAVSDTDGIVSKYTIKVADAGATAAVVSGDRLWAAPGAEPVKTTVRIAVDLTLAEKAIAGKACTVSFSGVYGDGNGKPGNEHDVYQAAKVTVKETAVVPVTPPPQPPVEPEKPKIDYTELNKQIGVAEGLKSAGYTDASWKSMTDALGAAKTALKSTSQDAVDAAAKTLKDAIAALVKMDYAKLNTALKAVENFTTEEELTDLWLQLVDAVGEGKALLTSGDQAAVDAAAAKISEILDQIKKLVEDLKTPETVVKEVEKVVEVLPEGDYCNIQMHRVWPVLFFVSLGVNVILIAVIGVLAAKKKKNRKDDTPLVDYDIRDDA